SLERLQAISGDTEFSGLATLSTADYALVKDFADLEEAMKAVAAQLCSVRVHVTKQVDEGEGYVAANGWTFSGTVSVGNPATTDFRWLTPGVAGPGNSEPTRSAATTDIRDNPGRVDFIWLPQPVTAASQLVISESVKTGYHLTGVTCDRNGTDIPV